jgi:hypothetical protein
MPGTWGALWVTSACGVYACVAASFCGGLAAHTGGVFGMAQLDMGNGFSINMDDVQTFIKALQDRVRSLQHTLETYALPLQIPAPGHDDYSGGWANDAQTTVNDYIAWNEGQQQTFTTLIGKAQAAVAQYQQTEQHNTMGS